MSKTFSVPLLNSMSHTEESKRILTLREKNRGRSIFLRTAILKFATARGFELVDILNSDRPEYITVKYWQRITETQERATAKLYFVDCNFAVAFFWLRSLPEFKYCNKSELMREIILSHQ